MPLGLLRFNKNMLYFYLLFSVNFLRLKNANTLDIQHSKFKSKANFLGKFK